MPIRLSSIPEYLEFMNYFHEKKYIKAKRALKGCLDIVQRENDIHAQSFIFELLAEVEHFLGNDKAAIVNLQRAEEVDVNSPLSKYRHAKFLLKTLNQNEQAINKCQEAIDIVSAEDWPIVNNELDKDFYLAHCYALQGYSYCLLGNFDKAISCLKQLMMIETTYAIDYAMELCDALRDRGFIEEADQYLQRVLTWLKKSPDKEAVAQFQSKVSAMLGKRSVS